MAGYHASIYAYGQTGSGKTYTMQGLLGDEERVGLCCILMTTDMSASLSGLMLQCPDPGACPGACPHACHPAGTLHVHDTS